MASFRLSSRFISPCRYLGGGPNQLFLGLLLASDAEMYVKNEVARSNCFYGAWAVSTGAAELPEAAAAARISTLRRN